MEPWLKLVTTLAVCAALGVTLYKLKVPGGMLLGAVLGAVLLSVFFDAAYMPSWGKLIAQITAGAFIGCTMSREELSELKTVYKPAAVMLLSLLVINVLIGLALWAVGYSDLITALMCGVPGGMTDVPLIAADMGADVSKVTVVHFARMLAGVGVMPSLIMYVSSKREGTPLTVPAESAAPKKAGVKLATPWALALVFAVSTAFALLAKYFQVPSGAIMFAIIGALVLKLMGLKVVFPRWIKRAAQILSGAFIGCQMDFSGATLGGVALAIVIAVAGYMINSFVAGAYMTRRFHIPIKESMLILTPAGATDMALISADMGLISSRLVLLQIFRLLAVTMTFPQICWCLCRVILSL